MLHFLRGNASFWRSGRDSNPRAVARKLISSQPRYDHFDTAAFLIHFANTIRFGAVMYKIPHFCSLVNIAAWYEIRYNQCCM